MLVNKLLIRKVNKAPHYLIRYYYDEVVEWAKRDRDTGRGGGGGWPRYRNRFINYKQNKYSLADVTTLAQTDWESVVHWSSTLLLRSSFSWTARNAKVRAEKMFKDQTQQNAGTLTFISPARQSRHISGRGRTRLARPIWCSLSTIECEPTLPLGGCKYWRKTKLKWKRWIAARELFCRTYRGFSQANG